MYRALVLAAALAASALPAAAQTYKVDTRHSHVTWGVSRNNAMMFRGKLVNNSGTVKLDAAQGKGEVDITMDMNAVVTGIPALDTQLKSANFYNVEQFPTARFVSSQVVFKGKEPERIDGMLTLRGVTRPVSLAVTRFGCTRGQNGQEVCGADASGTFKRTEFGMNAFQQLLGEDVRIDIAIEASPAPQ